MTFFFYLIAVKAPPVNIQKIDTISFLMITAVFNVILIVSHSVCNVIIPVPVSGGQTK